MADPFEPGRGACGAYISAQTLCPKPPTRVGLITFGPPLRVWKAFTCDEHQDRLVVSRPVEERDRAELAYRLEKLRPAITPLAEGAEARELLERARAWATAQDV